MECGSVIECGNVIECGSVMVCGSVLECGSVMECGSVIEYGIYLVWKCMECGSSWSVAQNLLEHPVQFNYLMCWSKAERISLKMILDFGFLDYCTHPSRIHGANDKNS